MAGENGQATDPPLSISCASSPKYSAHQQENSTQLDYQILNH